MAFPLKQYFPKRFRRDGVVVPVVRLQGAIMAGGGFRQTLSLSGVAPLLERAFDVKAAPAVALIVNSPGGSPVQSRLIYKRIRDLAAEKNKRVLVFVEDVAASGGYMIACAGDEIIVDPSSIVGSIGVVSGSFGFVGLIDRLGIERRVHTSGTNKATLDPFRPERQEDVVHLLSLQEEVHKTFIDLVRDSRGLRLKAHDDLFTGLFWSGLRGLELGLVDAIGDIRASLRARFGDEVKLMAIQPKRGFFARRAPGGIGADLDVGAIGAAAFDRLVGLAEEKALWARYGL